MKNNTSKSTHKNKQNSAITTSKNSIMNPLAKNTTSSKNITTQSITKNLQSKPSKFTNSMSCSAMKNSIKSSTTQSLMNSKNFNNNSISINNSKKNSNSKNNLISPNKNNFPKNDNNFLINEFQANINNVNENNNDNSEEKLWKNNVALKKSMQLSPEELARILVLKKNQEKDEKNIKRRHNNFNLGEEIVKDPNDEPKSNNKFKNFIDNTKSPKFRSNTLNKISENILNDLNFNNSDVDDSINDTKSNSPKKNKNEQFENTNNKEKNKFRKRAKNLSKKQKKKVDKGLAKQKKIEIKYNILKTEAKQTKKVDKYQILISTQNEMKELYDNLKNRHIKKKKVKKEKKEEREENEKENNKNKKNIKDNKEIKNNNNKKESKENEDTIISEDDDKTDFDKMKKQYFRTNIFASNDISILEEPLYKNKFLDDYIEGKCPSLIYLLNFARASENNDKINTSKNPFFNTTNNEITKSNIYKNNGNMNNNRMEKAMKFYNILNGNRKNENNKKEENETDENYLYFSYDILLNSIDDKLKSLKNKNYDFDSKHLYSSLENNKINNKNENNSLCFSCDNKKCLQKQRKLKELDEKIKQMQISSEKNYNSNNNTKESRNNIRKNYVKMK